MDNVTKPCVKEVKTKNHILYLSYHKNHFNLNNNYIFLIITYTFRKHGHHTIREQKQVLEYCKNLSGRCKTYMLAYLQEYKQCVKNSLIKFIFQT